MHNVRTILFPWVILIATVGSLHAQAISQIHQAPLVLMGDFNATPDEVPVQIISSALKDASAISAKPLYGPPGTSNGFRDDNGHVSDHLPVLTEINLAF